MKLPGFTAETSLFNLSQHYQMVGSWSQSDGGINPASVPGCSPIRGFREEEEYINCTVRCRQNGGTVSGCKSTCCKEVTGNSCCYFL